LLLLLLLLLFPLSHPGVACRTCRSFESFTKTFPYISDSLAACGVVWEHWLADECTAAIFLHA
jgi:hypothetical protein